jgi:serine/threonine protein kinase
MKEIDNENAVWSRLFHPFILQMFDMMQLDDSTIIVSELAACGTLLDFIHSHGRPGLPEPTKQTIFSQISHALSYLHTKIGLIHHDIKLENILLNHELQVKLCDFGLAETMEDDHINCFGICCSNVKQTLHLSMPRTKTEVTAGSLHYLAPEQLQGKHYKKPYCDMWALGCCLFAMDTGSLPFNDDFLPRLQMFIMMCKYDQTLLSLKLVDLVDHLLCAEPADRYTIENVLSHTYCLSLKALSDLGFK